MRSSSISYISKIVWLWFTIDMYYGLCIIKYKGKLIGMSFNWSYYIKVFQNF